jgi:hypothetical protein
VGSAFHDPLNTSFYKLVVILQNDWPLYNRQNTLVPPTDWMDLMRNWRTVCTIDMFSKTIQCILVLLGVCLLHGSLKSIYDIKRWILKRIP